MKDWHADLSDHMALPTTTMAMAWLVMRTDSQSFGWAESDIDALIGGVTFRASEGLSATAAHNTDSFSVDTLDVSAFLDVSTETELEAGVWDNASVLVFEYNFQDPPDALDNRVNILRAGTLGQVKRQQNRFTATLNGVQQRLSTRIGRQYSPLCPWRHAVWTGETFTSSPQCGVILTSFVHDGTVTSVGDNPALDFSDNATGQASDYYTQGFLVMTSGENAGMGPREIRRFVNDQFSLKRPFPFPVEVGDTYRAVSGDDHQAETCKTKYSNFVNFGGFIHVPGFNALIASPVGQTTV